MGKKRAKDKSPREDEEIDLTGPNCRHIKKGTDQTLLKKLTGSSDWTSCQDCKHEENKENTDTNQEPEEESETAAVWMCLKCGHRGCGRHSENQHAIKHYETPRSEPHCLVVSMDNWSVWCYICDDEVQYSRTGHLSQLVTSLQKQSSAEPIKRPQKRVKEEEVLMVLEVQPQTDTVTVMESEDAENKENKQQQKKNTKKESVVKKSSPTEDKGGVSVKGLSNLGNTCFFNAVIQSLSQTLLLRQTLNNVAEEKMSLDIKPGASSELEPVTVQLAQPGSLTLAMCGLLNEIQESKKGVVTPQELFTQVCKRAPRFRGFQQQDSQELLRYLLDGMRAEEHKRVSTGIVEALKQTKKSTGEEQLKTLVKEYEKNGFPQNLVDHVFGGELTSTIMCQQCKTVSVVTEMFLDLSLPILDEAYKKKSLKKAFQKTSESSPDERISPALTNGDDDNDVTSGGASKYQQKKAKKQAKKQAKQQKRQQKFEDRVTLDHLTSPSCSEGDQMDPSPGADEGETVATETHKEEGEGEAAPLTEGDAAQIPAADVGAQDQDTVQAEKEEKEEKEEEGEDSETDSSATSSVSNRFTVLSKNQDSKDGVLDDGNTSDVAPEAEEDTQLVSEMEKVTLDEAFVQDSDAADQSMEVEDEPEDGREYTVVNQDPELAFHTLASRTSPEKMDCSVESCLFQFTEVETLTENNSLLCVTCTKQRGNKDKAPGSKNNVYTDALKQMLISSPPPVLTLHMKRFKQSGHSISKVNRHVPFPLILDLASFCVVKCKNVTEGETQILYSLYGIVEHSGTMRSGHYTGYVKVRPEGPKSTSNGHALDGDAEPAKGSWFYVSDTSVQPVSESKVQSCQAYLLFYERIL
ncbi:ubiquitin carboxyl-terminal hydrolase 16 isoform X3 [Hippoglossus hippoglossus]|uniref:ubiquitin carboxyl-terminal hydrolase 16 isoform X3 n=1 Tax=Hippoglossus hippoglossus TaxID=8267 RepID=UPI00148DB5C8|nr:ubiquitin carboxyl-terminal hydrolase 16 isoform X3 [Hippoglossus hippoglossus]